MGQKQKYELFKDQRLSNRKDISLEDQTRRKERWPVKLHGSRMVWLAPLIGSLHNLARPSLVSLIFVAETGKIQRRPVLCGGVHGCSTHFANKVLDGWVFLG